MKKTIISSSVLVFLLAACAEQKKLDEMHDATLNMEKTTTKMNENTVQMKSQTDSLAKLTRELKAMNDELYDALRQGNSLQLRREAYKALLAAPDMTKKISEAGKYFMSFEIQLWNEFGQDQALEKRDLLKQQAAQEFFLEIEELAPKDGSVNPTVKPDAVDINSEANRSASFNAMAATLHKMNRKQDRAVKAIPTAKPVNMYSIMEEALLLPRDQVQTDAAAREVLAHEKKAIQLLQARYNIFPTIFIDAVSGIGAKNILQQGSMVYLGWEFNADSVSPTSMDYLINEVLVHAVSAKNLLIKLGHKPKMDDKVSKLLHGMTVKVNGKSGPEMVAMQTKFIELIQELRK